MAGERCWSPVVGEQLHGFQLGPLALLGNGFFLFVSVNLRSWLTGLKVINTFHRWARLAQYGGVTGLTSVVRFALEASLRSATDVK